MNPTSLYKCELSLDAFAWRHSRTAIGSPLLLGEIKIGRKGGDGRRRRRHSLFGSEIVERIRDIYVWFVFILPLPRVAEANGSLVFLLK